MIKQVLKGFLSGIFLLGIVNAAEATMLDWHQEDERELPPARPWAQAPPCREAERLARPAPHTCRRGRDVRGLNSQSAAQTLKT